MRFVFPHAPARPVTINGGYVMRAWYDILGLDSAQREDEPGLRASQALVEALIAREKARGIPAARIVLAGFSQGCAMTLMTGLRHAERLAGLVGLSGYLPLAATLGGRAPRRQPRTPIFLAHGTADPVMPIARGAASRDALIALGHRVEWHEYADAAFGVRGRDRRPQPLAARRSARLAPAERRADQRSGEKAPRCGAALRTAPSTDDAPASGGCAGAGVGCPDRASGIAPTFGIAPRTALASIAAEAIAAAMIRTTNRPSSNQERNLCLSMTFPACVAAPRQRLRHCRKRGPAAQRRIAPRGCGLFTPRRPDVTTPPAASWR